MATKLILLTDAEVSWPARCARCGTKVNLTTAGTTIGRGTSLRPTLDFLTPVQTTCNYATLLLRNAASLFSDGDANGNWQRFIIISAPTQRGTLITGPNNESGPSDAPANGPTPENHLHVNPYPNTASPGQTNECEAGNERYAAGRTVLTNPPVNQGTRTQGQQR